MPAKTNDNISENKENTVCDMCFRNDLDIPRGRNMFEGESDTQRWARDVLWFLVQCAQEPRTTTFSELTDELGLPRRGYPRQMALVCRHIIKTLAELEMQDDWKEEEIPHITSIVLKTNGKVPTNMCRVLTGNSRRQPSPKRLQIELNCSFCYEHWDAVLAALPY